ncbi:unnamed protein product [Closterium sp. NIES-65]|nr:unnamed protein product [Closterium sp. NIES-65]
MRETGEMGRAVKGEMGRAVKGEMGRAVKGEMGRAVKGEMGRAVKGEMGRAVKGETQHPSPLTHPSSPSHHHPSLTLITPHSPIITPHSPIITPHHSPVIKRHHAPPKQLCCATTALPSSSDVRISRRKNVSDRANVGLPPAPEPTALARESEGARPGAVWEAMREMAKAECVEPLEGRPSSVWDTQFRSWGEGEWRGCGGFCWYTLREEQAKAKAECVETLEGRPSSV